MEEIKAKYPEVVSYIDKLPSHVAEEVGSMAVGLSHEDMHPKVEIQGNYGLSESAIDFSRVITDPEYDSSQLADEALHAAKLGKEKVAEAVFTTSKALNDAHEKLVGEGFKFGASELETDEERAGREETERRIVYDTALTQAVEVARAAKDVGDSEAAVSSLETVLLLFSVQGGESRKPFREAVRGGMADELLRAAQSTGKLFADNGDGMSRVNGYAVTSAVKALLELSTGKSLDESFVARGELNPNSFSIPVLDEDIRDAVAVLTSKDNWLNKYGRESGVFSGSTVIKKIEERYKADAIDGDIGSGEYLYQLVEEYGDPQLLSDAFGCTDPKEAVEAADRLGIPIHQVVGDFGRKMDNDVYSPVELNKEAITQMEALKHAHPKAFSELVIPGQSIKRAKTGWTIDYVPAEVSKALDKLAESGIELSGIPTALTKHEDKEAFANRAVSFVRACQEVGVDADSLDVFAKKSGLSLSEAIDKVGRDEHTANQVVEKLLIRSEIVDAYMEIYSKLEYPITSFKNFETPDFDKMPRLKERMISLGLPEDVASDMFKSWRTYQAFIVDNYQSDGFHFPDEKPEEGQLERIAKKQAEALEEQLARLEGFVREYGLEITNSVIENFGIYNFARFDAAKLAKQNEDWKSGGKVSSVVVSARNDWNSFTAGSTIFVEGVGDGVFYFEANSGRDTARAAVMVGQHERNNGRAPDIRRFIVFGHANPEGIVMGVNGERISTDMYIESASKAKKINASEVNDYTKHLGENFEVILQGCSTAGEPLGGKNIAQTISERHSTKVEGSDVTITGVLIQSDGSVKFSVDEGDGNPIIYGK